MKNRKRRQIELAKIFYEMGMEEDLVSKISGLEKEELKMYLSVDNKNIDEYNNKANKN